MRTFISGRWLIGIPVLFFAKIAFCLCFVSLGACAEQKINGAGNVERFYVAGYMLEVTRYNMELNPALDLLVLDAHGEKRMRQHVESIIVNGEQLDFSQSSGAFVESVEVEGDALVVLFDYFYLEGGEDLIKCRWSVPSLGTALCSVEARND